MRVLVLTPYLYGTAPGPRSSIELWEHALEPAGVEFDYAPFESSRLHEILYKPRRHAQKAYEMAKGLMRRVTDVRRAREYDAVLVYREAALLGPEFFERWVARIGVPIVYQLDDPLYVPYRSPSNGYLSYLKFFSKVGRIARMSAVTVVNSDQHEEYAARYAARVEQIPSMVDGDVFTYSPRAPKSDREPVRIGWSGSVTTVPNLRHIHGVLRALSDRTDVEVHLIGPSSFNLPGVRCTTHPWRADTEVEDLRRLDIGLLPLPTDEWTKRKFYLKLVQYSALGIPAVATPLGANAQVIEPGRTGFLARDEREWMEALTRLIEDGDLRGAMGKAAAHRAHGRYTVQANAVRIAHVFQGLDGR